MYEGYKFVDFSFQILAVFVFGDVIIKIVLYFYVEVIFFRYFESVINVIIFYILVSEVFEQLFIELFVDLFELDF